MRINIKYFLLFFVLISAAASAQKKLLVYHTTGDVNIISDKPTPAKRGAVIAAKNSLQVKAGANCMLIESTGKSLQISTAGTYTYTVLQTMMSQTKSDNVTTKFFSYVYENLFSSDHSDKISVTPVVFRSEDLMKTPADNTIIIADEFTLGWKKPAGKTPVRLVIKDSADKKMFDTVLKQTTSVQINTAEHNLLSGNIYKWKTEEFDTHQPKEKYFSFIIAKKEDRKKILKDIKLLQNNNLSLQVKTQMQQDIFMKWKNYYSKSE